MNNILIISQDGNLTCFAKSIAIGERQKTGLIGDKLYEALNKANITLENLIEKIGNSYREQLQRVYSNQEVPKKKLLEKLIRFFDVDNNYFGEKELRNVLITDGGIVVAKYPTNKDTEEKKMDIDKIILDSYRHNQPIIINLCAK